MIDMSVILLHDPMEDRAGNIVTTALTPIDLHDLARSCRTYGVQNFFVAHPSMAMRSLAYSLLSHWEEGFGATYNPNRKDALSKVAIVADIDDAIAAIESRTGKLPKLIATSARNGPDRISYQDFRSMQHEDPYLLLFGTGWGMAPELLKRADLFLAPIVGPTEYNHLSVRSACAIILDRVFGA